MEIYQLIRFILIIFIISLLVMSIVLLAPKKFKTIVNGFTVGFISIISILVSSIILIIIGYIADEQNKNGDTLSTFLFFIIIGINLINWIIYKSFYAKPTDAN
ncbi:hypothetical protein [Bacillus massilinigeriensis]|uniref:hypothetical protein n=1 Tax=Bacillus massilionigeriensis TaxID=1805475 RepID=UPI00096B4886|nr:hypothetical protein [Bacillus massilionigeriensis]